MLRAYIYLKNFMSIKREERKITIYKSQNFIFDIKLFGAEDHRS